MTGFVSSLSRFNEAAFNSQARRDLSDPLRALQFLVFTHVFILQPIPTVGRHAFGGSDCFRLHHPDGPANDIRGRLPERLVQSSDIGIIAGTANRRRCFEAARRPDNAVSIV